MENPSGNGQAQQSLALLAESRNRTEIEGALPHTPLWYAPALATGIAGAAIFDGGTRHWAWLVLAVFIAGAMLAHHLGTIRVQPRRSIRTVVANLIAVGVTWLLLAFWGVLASTASDDLFYPWLAIAAWFCTTAVLGLAMTMTNRRRRRALST